MNITNINIIDYRNSYVRRLYSYFIESSPKVDKVQLLQDILSLTDKEILMKVSIQHKTDDPESYMILYLTK